MLPWGQRPDHPRFFARIGSPSTYVGALADAAASGVNAFTGSWTGGSGPSAVDLTVIDWLRGWCGMPERTAGVLTSGGSLASLTAFAAARQGRLGGPSGTGVVYVTDQTHASLPRAVALLGERTRVLPCDAGQRLEPAALRAAVEEDRGDGLQPFCVVATAGTTSTGAIDPLRELHAASRELGLWLHVDGAYGAPAALTPGGAAALDGLGLADSLAIDPHKWLFQPYEIGCVLVREPGLLEDVFSLEGAYLRDTAGGTVDFRDRSPELTRGARGLTRRGCASATAGRSSRPPRSGSSRSAATGSMTTPTRGCRPPRSRTATPRRARPSSGIASSCACARSTRARRSRTSTRRST